MNDNQSVKLKLSHSVPPKGPHKHLIIFDFLDVRDYLLASLAKKKAQNPSYSIRAWARQLGLKTQALLVNVLAGDRKLSVEFGNLIAMNLGLNGRELEYFKALVLSNLAQDQDTKTMLEARLSELRPDQFRTNMSLSNFKIISEWFHFTILEQFSLREPSSSLEELETKLRGKVTKSEISQSIRLLTNLGYLVESDDKLRRSAENVVVRGEVPSLAIRKHHLGMLDLAKSALEEQSIHEREFRSTKLCIREEDYEKAKGFIKDFHEKMQKLSVRGEAKHVYAFNSQLFKLTGDEI
jgi:uncharacterized protein (TIGR02147 family)